MPGVNANFVFASGETQCTSRLFVFEIYRRAVEIGFTCVDKIFPKEEKCKIARKDKTTGWSARVFFVEIYGQWEIGQMFDRGGETRELIVWLSRRTVT